MRVGERIGASGRTLPRRSAVEDTIDDSRIVRDVEARLFGSSDVVVRLDRYEVVSRLGAGGFGVVYSALDPKLGRKVALKHLCVGGAVARSAFREARALAAVSHPNIVTVHDATLLADGSALIAMELVEGSNYAQILEECESKRVPPGWEDVLRILLPAAEGLVAAHAAGVVHRDFKPANILVTDGGGVSVTDFGLASAESGSPREDGTRVGPTLVGGTPGYSAPEQDDGVAAQASADVFSFAATLYRAVEGRLPFEGASIAALVAAKRSGEPQPWRRRGTPGWLRRAILRGLARRPEARHPSMEAFVAVLRMGLGRKRRAALAGGLIVVGAAVAVLVGGPARDPCGVFRPAADESWQEERPSVAQRLAELRQPASVQAALSRLDDFADAWRRQTDESCAGLRSDAHAQRQRASGHASCLVRARATLDGFLTEVGRLPAQDVDRAVDAVTGSLAQCGDYGPRLGMHNLGPEQRAVFERLDEIESQRLGAASGVTAAQLRDLLDSHPTADVARAQVLLDLGHAEFADGDTRSAEQRWFDTIELAGRLGVPVLEASALEGVLVAANHRHDCGSVGLLRASVTAKLAALGDPAATGAAVRRRLGELEASCGGSARARDLFVEAEQRQRELGNEVEVAFLTGRRARLEAQQGDLARALELSAQAHSKTLKLRGPDSRDAAFVAFDHAVLLEQAGELDEAARILAEVEPFDWQSSVPLRQQRARIELLRNNPQVAYKVLDGLIMEFSADADRGNVPGLLLADHAEAAARLEFPEVAEASATAALESARGTAKEVEVRLLLAELALQHPCVGDPVALARGAVELTTPATHGARVDAVTRLVLADALWAEPESRGEARAIAIAALPTLDPSTAWDRETTARWGRRLPELGVP